MRQTLPALFCLFTAVVGTNADAAPTVEERIATGEVVVQTRKVAGVDLPEAIVTAVVDSPPAKVWAVVSDCARYKKTMPRIAESRLVSQNGNKVVCEVTVAMPFPLSNLTSLNEATHTVGPPTWERKWHLIKGDYARNDGSWTLTPYNAEGTRTKVVYRVLADPNTSVPNAIIRKAQQSALPDMIQHVRRHSR
jgi:ribosome-associated toxin RatA of RatAB toxin-antitoxin module